MSGWPEDDCCENNEAALNNFGAQYYGFVFGHPCIRSKLFMPNGELKDKEGNFQKAKFTGAEGNLTGKFDSATEETQNSCDVRVCTKWMSDKSFLENLTKTEKEACSKIKEFLNKTEALAWYHNDNGTGLCQFGGPHLHVGVAAKERGAGGYQTTPDLSIYRNLKKAIKVGATDDKKQYAKYITINNMLLWTAHMQRAPPLPRVFLGTNSKHLLNQYQKALRVADNSYVEADYSKDDDEETAASSRGVKRARMVDYDEEIDDMPMIITDKQKMTLKDTKQDNCVRILEQIVNKTGCVVFEKINSFIGTSLKKSDPYRQVWDRLVTRPSTRANLKLLQDKLKMSDQLLSLKDLAARYIGHHGDDRHLDRMSIGESLRFYFEFMEHNDMDFDEFTQTVIDVYNKVNPKKNAMLLMGPAHCGKTYLLLRSLFPLSPFSVIQGSNGNASEFAFQDLPGGRASFWDECTIDPNNISCAKMLFEGNEDTPIKIKFQGTQPCGRIPIYAMSNVLPWFMATTQTDKDAMAARTSMWYVKSIPELEQIRNYLHPGMWYNLCCAKETDSPLTLESALCIPVELEQFALEQLE